MVIQDDLQSIDKELCSFYDFCKQSGFTQREMDELCKPLYQLVRKRQLVYLHRILLMGALLFLIGYVLTQSETFSWHVSAIARITMIKILPFWNWRPLAREKCLVNAFDTIQPSRKQFDCTFCEITQQIPYETLANLQNLNDMFIDVHKPVVVLDALHDWPPLTKLNLTEQIMSDYKIAYSVPCELSSNFAQKWSNVKAILRKAPKFKSWFYHFQNCELESTKSFRVYAPRPKFLPEEIAPIQYSWVLASNEYPAPYYKPVKLVDKIAVFAQINGKNYIRLRPRLNCEGECQILEGVVQSGEALVLTALYDFEYKPFEVGQNLAVILETN